MDAGAFVDEFRVEHGLIEAHLTACESLLSHVAHLHTKLLELRPFLLAHFDRKDAFYVKLVAGCAESRDLATAQLFERNMKVQAGAVRRFFAALDTPGSPLLAQSFKTMALIIRGRLSQEERSVFPLYLKVAPAP